MLPSPVIQAWDWHRGNNCLLLSCGWLIIAIIIILIVIIIIQRCLRVQQDIYLIVDIVQPQDSSILKRKSVTDMMKTHNHMIKCSW